VTAAIRITKRVVDQLRPGEIVWDDGVAGFGVRCQMKRKVYVLKLRIRGRQRWMIIGDHGRPWTAETARHEAQRLWGEIRSGVDIAELRDSKRDGATVADLCQRFLKEHARHHKKPLSIAADERNIANHIVPLIGTIRVDDVTRADIDRVKRAVRDGATRRKARLKSEGGPGGRPVLGGPGAANRVLALLSKMFNLAEDWGWRSENTNPVRRIGRYQGKACGRFLTTEEVQRLGEALALLEENRAIPREAAAAIRLLLFTGARLGEIMTLKWSYVDLERRLLNLPDSKTGAKAIHLNEPAIGVLNGLPRGDANDYVIADPQTGAPLGDLQHSWRLVRRVAGLDGVRIHDLRHSFASFAVLSGGTLPVIGKILGHASPFTTARYAHLGDNPTSSLAETTGRALDAALNARTSRG